MDDLDRIARALPDVTPGVACAGTALESRTFAVRKKSFLFVSPKDARLKLEASCGEAERLGYDVGANGWVKVPLAALPAAAVLRRWIAESHAVVGCSAAAKPPKPAPARRRTLR